MIPKLKDIITGKARGHIKAINHKAEIGLTLIKNAYKINTLYAYKEALGVLKKELTQIAKLSREIKK